MNPKVVASECCAGRHPQNTRRGFEFCLESGVDGIEFDVHLSLDGHVVVQHDYRLNGRITRDVSGRWLPGHGPALRDLSLSELKQFDVGRYAPGSREAASYPDYEPAEGERIPTLEELLELHRAAGSDADLWIELKTTPFDRDISADPMNLLSAVLRLVEDFGLVSKTVLLAFEWQLLMSAGELCPGIGRDFLTINPAFVRKLYKNKGPIDPKDMLRPLDPAEHGGSLPGTIAAAGGGWWGPYVGDVTGHDVDLAHEQGVMVNVWGVASNEQAIDEALRLNADAITLSDSTRLQQRLA